jgi:hypothetical protein
VGSFCWRSGPAAIPGGLFESELFGHERGASVTDGSSASAPDPQLDFDPVKVKSDAAGLLAVTVSEAGEVAPVLGP